MNPILEQLATLFEERGSSLYGGEAVTQLEHALQAAWLAELAGENAPAIAAALLHDVGHLLHDLPEDAPDDGIDDVHEELGCNWLGQHFGPEVSEPVRMHVAAKRYLCATDPNYHDSLSPPSQQSLALQGGPFSDDEVHQFEEQPYFEISVRLRHWDDQAKIEGLKTPSLDHFLPYVEQSILAASSCEARP